jgi:hypothetical protein
VGILSKLGRVEVPQMSLLLPLVSALVLLLPNGDQVVGPITSAPDPSEPVPFLWALHRSHSAAGHRLLLSGGTIHAVPSDVRLVDSTGQVVATAATSPAADGNSCPGSRGIARAELPLRTELLAAFAGGEAPADYQIEARVGGTWRSTVLTFAGCESTE